MFAVDARCPSEATAVLLYCAAALLRQSRVASVGRDSSVGVALR
jgi:hypothetical protein